MKYVVEYCGGLNTDRWQLLNRVQAEPSARIVEVIDAINHREARFYRVYAEN